MHLTSGTKLGNYEILAPLGAGGMGEVYRAKDTKLDREVAIKVMPVGMAQDRERLARFEREAKVLASLNHPNIAQIYGLEDNALVMELVPGQTLTVPQPLEKALHYAKQIAEALEAAHEKGITHRDLKPANIMITPEGAVKVLDFGLASVPTRETNLDPENSPTMTMAATQAGMIMGTAAYMSPEQAAGKAVDKRSDIWSFGVVLYEMLAGQKLFDGETLSHILAHVLTAEIDFSKLPPTVPGEIVELVRRCLDRDLKTRLQAIGEARIAIGKYGAASRSRLPIEPRVRPRASSNWAWALAGVLGLVAASALWMVWHRSQPGQPLVSLDLDLGAELSLLSIAGSAAVPSPDAKRIVFVSLGPDGTRRLYTRWLAQPKAFALPKTEGAYAPFFSPDGQSVGFFAKGKLNKTRLDGGLPVSLCQAPAGRGASWNEDDTIIAALDNRGVLSQIPVDGGKPVQITQLEGSEIGHRWPQVLPGGKAVLFMANTTPANYSEASIVVVTLGDHRRKTLLERAGMYPRYLAGYLTYVRKEKLFAVAFDPVRLEVRGLAAPVLDGFISDPTFGDAQAEFSRQGTLAYRRGKAVGMRTIHSMDAAGNLDAIVAEPALYQMPRFSPDGSRLAYSVTQGANSDIWIYDLRQGNRARMTGGMDVNSFPVWTPDGRHLVFSSVGGTFCARSDGAGSPEPFTTNGALTIPASFTPDGTRLAVYDSNPSGGSIISTIPVQYGPSGPKAGKPELFLKTEGGNPNPVFSPDGKWIAYAAAGSGTYEVYVRSFPDRGTQWQISNNGGGMPRWSGNGHELFYRTDDQRIMVVDYEVKGDTLVTRKPRLWSNGQLANTGFTLNLDVSPDGKRFAVVMPVEGPEPRETQSHVTLVLNFFDEVRRRVP